MGRALIYIMLAIATAPIFGVPAQIIVIRHAEKPNDRKDQHLSEAGRARAQRFVHFLKANTVLTQFGLPVVLFATHQTKGGGGQRPAETLEPLAHDLMLPIETPYQSNQPAKLAEMVLTSKPYDGKTVLICWTHEYIPQLMESLGVNPPPKKLPDDVYDCIYVIRFDSAHVTLQSISQDIQSNVEPEKAKCIQQSNILKK